jgi:putative phosphoribosyl transferase
VIRGRRRFADRVDAGQQLGQRLAGRDDLAGALVLGLPRGGVVVAAEVAHELGAPLDVVVVRKLGVPGQEELAFGAVTGDGHRVLNDDVVAATGLSSSTIDEVTSRETARAAARAQRYRGARQSRSWEGRPVVLVDDGVATGATLRAALDVVVAHRPAVLVVAVPVAPPGLARRLGPEVDEVVVLTEPADFIAVGQVYRRFDEVSDDEVAGCLAQGPARGAG